MSNLLAPAGNMEKLKVAVAYGADEVYFGLKNFSLRNFAGNFTIDEAAKAITYLHERGKKGYATINIYPFENEYTDIVKNAKELEDAGVDALIVADLGVLSQIKKAGIKSPIHISTQANTLSPQTVMAYKELGASRVNLARELSVDQISSLQKGIKDIETEVFVHGAVCFSYSGRCSISDYMTGRRANRGECTHPCRWQYSIVEKERPDETLTVAEDERGLYLFNSKDLALYEFITPLKEAGVTSFKIEGRMKSIHYLASVVSLYRKIIDGEPLNIEETQNALSKVKNRGYSSGFMKGNITVDDYRFENNDSKGNSKFLGIVSNINGNLAINVRNKMRGGQNVEVLFPDGTSFNSTLPEFLTDMDGKEEQVLNHGKNMVLKETWPEFSIIRTLDETTG
ncbi:MAG: U32 family peptidase [Deltaproteobacteria bacterium]|nr:U32 family peptidase [Deltaproteobacteria bacterium]